MHNLITNIKQIKSYKTLKFKEITLYNLLNYCDPNGISAVNYSVVSYTLMHVSLIFSLINNDNNYDYDKILHREMYVLVCCIQLEDVS